MEYDIHLEHVTSRPLAVVRRRATLPELGRVIPEACGKVWSVVRSLKVPAAGRHVAIYWDNVFNLDIGVELEAPFAGHDEVVGATLPGGTVAKTVHFGPYQLLAAAHDAVQRWCAANGHTLAGPCWELYDHWKDEWNNDPSKIRTDVSYLLKDGGQPDG